MTRRRRAMGALLLAVTISGCTGDPEPGAGPSLAPTTPATALTSEPTEAPTSVTATPTQAPVVLSPEETVRAWVKAFNTASSTGDMDPLRQLSTEACLQCSQLIDGISKIYSRGGSIDSSGWRVARAKRKPGFGTTGTIATFIKSGSGVIVPESGAQPQNEAADDFLLDWRVERVGAQWLVAELTFLS